IRDFHVTGVQTCALPICGLDFSIARGDFVAVKGASGVGKSTFLHILGLLDQPTSGRVLFKGRETKGLADKELSGIRNHELGFVRSEERRVGKEYRASRQA